MTINELEHELAALKEKQDKLSAELERLKVEEAQVKPWRAEKNVGYCFVRDIGEIFSIPETGRESDYDRYKIGNYYRTRELAEQDAKELALRGRVRQLRDALCYGHQFVPHKINYYIIYNHDEEEFQYDFWEVFQPVGGVFFDTREHAQTACDILNHELANGNIKI